MGSATETKRPTPRDAASTAARETRARRPRTNAMGGHTKEELERSTALGRNANVVFIMVWALTMFIVDGVVYAVDPPPGESKWGYGPSVFLLCLVRRARLRRGMKGRCARGWTRDARGGGMVIEARDAGRSIDGDAREV